MTSSLTLNEYQDHTQQTAVYPESGTGSKLALAYVGLGLGEAGEVQGKIKKILRDDPQAQEEGYGLKVAAEMGDVLWYIARLADELGYTLGEIAHMNLDKLYERQRQGTLKGAGDDR